MSKIHIPSLPKAAACAALAASMAIPGAVHAAMAPADVERLGKDLTPVGAEKAASKDGSIPSWEGGITRAPAGFDPKAGYADPLGDDKVQYTITSANMAQYKDKLAPGQMEMLKRYPTYKINVYKSHRTAALPASMYEHIKAEAGKAELASGGSGVVNIQKSSVPFPQPKSGVEAIWNHVMRYRGGSVQRFSTEFPVQANGAFTPVTRSETIAFAHAMPKPEANRLLYYTGAITGPASMAGEAIMVIDPLDQVKENRLAWSYNPGQRRVLRAPDIAYDSPGQGADGLRTTDDYDGFNGAPDRYDWKLVGKKEMIISYNNYKITSKSLKYADIVRPGHVNQDLVRYEPHRVWVVEATLKDGKRHVYGKRVFYIDEDTWQVAHADAYDGRGELWRVHEIGAIQYYDAPTPYFAYEAQYDLQARRYLLTGLSNQEKPIKFGLKLEPSYFTPDNLRRLSN
ncbi:DUF1329 domain-containing protein [Pseudoduganella ginsengisoli]|uniref:DUF1329 domain-containing protein n=1 Tax=Pseudoduganella ginsengisoli TaxID=1462440 RepID=A0A6L6Q5Q6_9BURK|nr:DUF1329 domain-containing protein [Pseudoduganella ginsengisoli]MTW05010.1 DUF1329 domain-containing protein [Pseudoduganella ginsengisoli]